MCVAYGRGPGCVYRVVIKLPRGGNGRVGAPGSGFYKSVEVLWPGNSVARLQSVQSPDFGLLGLRSWRQQTLAPSGTSKLSVLFLRMTTWRLLIKPSPWLQSPRLVKITSTLTRSQNGLLRVNLEEPLLGASDEHAATSNGTATHKPCRIASPPVWTPCAVAPPSCANFAMRVQASSTSPRLSNAASHPGPVNKAGRL